MRKVLIIGIGCGNPDYLTVQAINALNQVDVFFVTDKGEDKAGLARLRREICERYITDRTYRVVEISDPPRDRAAEAYRDAVTEWHGKRRAIYQELIASELSDAQCGAFLVWGDPTIYDSTLRIINDIAATGSPLFDYQVIPGISSVQALAAAHKIPLNEIGEPIHITTGRRLATKGWPSGADDVIVMLDGHCTFRQFHDPAIEIYWGACIGTPDEVIRQGRVVQCADEIEVQREALRARKGWIMDTYLLKRSVKM